MEPSLPDVLRMLDASVEHAKALPVELDDEYRRLIALVEALPQCQSGADRTSVWRHDAAFRAEMRAIRRI